MVFVYEWKDQWTEADIKKVAELTAAVGEEIPPSSWVIDRESGLVFLCLSAGRQSLHSDEQEAGRYVLFVDDEVVSVEAHMLLVPRGIEHYLICRMEVPAKLQAIRNKIIEILRQAFIEKGKSYSNQYVTVAHVKVEFAEGLL